MPDLTTTADIDAFLDAADNAAARTALGVPSLAANTFTAAQLVQLSALGTTPAAGVTISNSTAAAAGAQQVSPQFVQTGYGWKTDATAASQAVTFASHVLPIQGSAEPLGDWKLQSKIGSGSYTTVMTVHSPGGITTRNIRLGTGAASNVYIPADDWTIILGAGNDVYLSRAAAKTLQLADEYGGTGSTFRITGDGTTGSKYLSLAHNGTNALIGVTSGNLHISGLPTSNPGAGILWNNAGTPAIGT